MTNECIRITFIRRLWLGLTSTRFRPRHRGLDKVPQFPALVLSRGVFHGNGWSGLRGRWGRDDELQGHITVKGLGARVIRVNGDGGDAEVVLDN